eukprot:c8321_g1_i2.p1 GENE.c8321_g1_i2~~c8321_g1_i2.p1  ORF type:complete len:423 (+),score=82.42 c8321_g1_i2:55-1269(+)
MRSCCWVSFVLWTFVFSCPDWIISQDTDENDAGEENWYAVRLSDVPAGFMIMRENVTNGLRHHFEHLSVEIERGSHRVRLEADVWTNEHKNGTLVSAGFSQMMGQHHMHITHLYNTHNHSVTTRSIEGEGEPIYSFHTIPNEPAFYGQINAKRAFQQQCARVRNGDEHHAAIFQIQTVKPELGPLPVLLTRELIAQDSWNVKVSNIPAPMIEVYSSACSRLIRMTIDIMFGKMEMEYVPEPALAVWTSERVPEIVHSMTVPLFETIPNVRQASRVEMRVSTKSDGIFELPTVGFQTATPQANNTWEVVVDIANLPIEATTFEKHDVAYVTASGMINHEDSIIRSLAQSTLAEEFPSCASDQIGCVRNLRNYVTTHFSKVDLETGFASASEAARTHTGDCSEHAV